jgi:ssRNA-specific RNase YbeY (16S rRNA maturation enzyme)
MGNAATKAKQKWNKEHYRQIKVSVPHVVAQRFKAACALTDTSMSAELVKFMAAYAEVTDVLPAHTEKRGLTPLASKGKRRKLLGDIFRRLQEIRAAEETYRDFIPENMEERVRRAEESLDVLDAALESLGEAMDAY